MIDLKKPMIECMYFIDPRLEIRAIWDSYSSQHFTIRVNYTPTSYEIKLGNNLIKYNLFNLLGL